MRPSLFASLVCAACLISSGQSLLSQPPEIAPSRPLRKPSRKELDRLEALKVYALAVQLERKNQLPEALRTYEKALRLDPDSTSIRRALVPLYLAFDRQDEALDACRKVLDREPGDFETWYLLARQFRTLDREPDARDALEKALVCKGLSERPELHLEIALDLGALREKSGTFEKAEAAFRVAVEVMEHNGAALEIGPEGKEELTRELADTYERIGRICLKAKDPGKAIKAFQTAQARDPARAARLALNLAEVMHAQDRSGEALRHLDQYLARQPSGTEGYELKIKLLRKLNRGGDVVPALEQHSRGDSHNNDLKMLLARECRTGGRREQAERIYEDLLTASPNTDVYRGLFAAWKDEGAKGTTKLLNRLDGAINTASPDDEKKAADANQAVHVRHMLVVLREDADAVKALLPAAHRRILDGPKLAYKTRVLLGALAERTNQLGVAEALYRSCLDGEGRVRVAGTRREMEAEVYSGLLKVLSMARKYPAVVELCQQGLRHAEATNRAMFYLDLAFAHMNLGKDKEALEAADQAVEVSIDKQRLACRCTRVSLTARAGRFKEAEAEGKALLKEHHDEADVRMIRFTLSELYSHSRETEKAEEQLKAVLDADPVNARANNDLGYLWADRNKNLEEAERMIRRALELDRQQRAGNDALGLDSDRENAAYVDSLGWVLFRRGRWKEAREQLQKASLLPDGAEDPTVWDHLGDVHARLKEDDKARECWKKALDLYDATRRHRKDERYKDIQEKVKVLQGQR